MAPEAEEQRHDVEQALLDLAEKLAARRRHVVFLLGAGTACAAGLPDLNGLSAGVEGDLDGSDKTNFQRLAESRNIEEVLTQLRLIAATTAGTTQSIDGLDASAAKALDRRVCSAIAKVILGAETTLEHHVRFARWVARSRYEEAVEIFTTNYDLLLEAGLEEAGAPYFDGFVGVIKGRFRSDLVDPPSVSSSSTAILPAAWARLWKLHGSVSWVEEEDGRVIARLGGASADPGLALVIYPSLEKYIESRRLPFVVLGDRFRRALATPETVVVVAGYSFRDDHINELIFEAARLHPRSEIVALFRQEIPAAVAAQAVEVPNLTALGREEGIVGGVRAKWRAPVNASVAWDGGFALGDFAVLSRYLAREVSGQPEGDGDVAE